MKLVVKLLWLFQPLQLHRAAGAAGARTVSGIDMLAWQGALAFEKWTGHAAPLELMRRVAVKMLEKNED
jgi:shikimate dehydrogenase